jgi:3-isopropylmalate/(R)-2-methylmalate dehydratase large subunit
LLKGKLAEYADPKDIAFYLAMKYSAGFGIYKSFEFSGPGVEALSISNRLTLASHAVELGAKFCLFDYDEKTMEFLSFRPSFDLKKVIPVAADPDANYEQEIEIDLDLIEPLVAKPHHFENIGTLDEVAGPPMHQAQIGSCANGRVEDIRSAAKILNGRKVHPETRLFVQPASWNVYRECMKEGLFEIILDAGGQILSPGCHLCLGMQARLGNSENCITSTTRNHKGRLGGINSNIYLGSPKVVAASAIAGKIVDIRKGF